MRIESDVEIIPGRVYIYALLDPRDGDIRYIGKTNNPRLRYKQHLKSDKSLEFVMYILFESDLESVYWDELTAIAQMQEYGFDLFNIVHTSRKMPDKRETVLPVKRREVYRPVTMPVKQGWIYPEPVRELTYTTFGFVGEKELYNAIVLDYQYDNEMPREDFYGR
jgi:hypothetical protein